VSGRIVPAAAERVASRDALQSLPRPTTRAVLIDGIDGVLAARRRKPALPAEQSAEGDTVGEDEADQDSAHVV